MRTLFDLEIVFDSPQEGICGVDEVGRGPLAGPVVAAAVLPDPRQPIDGLADSKVLTAEQREGLAGEIRAKWIIALGAASLAEIERRNILHASMLAMERAVARLPLPPRHVLVDGNRLPVRLPCPATALVKGDALAPAISAAAIVAKVARDRMMQRLGLRYPGYGWETNAGYGTAVHRAALGRLGATPHHRRSFAPVAALLAGEAAPPHHPDAVDAEMKDRTWQGNRTTPV
mgnify:CR=1 FL=1